MEWIVTKQIQSSDGKTEIIKCELWLDFEPTQWNKKTKSPVLEIYFYNRKVEDGWWIDKAKTNWYTSPPQKHCEIKFTYFQRQPIEKFYSGGKRTSYNDFTLDFCKKKAIEIFTSKLNNIVLQCSGKK
jgi:hypothetical protein